ncbi:polymerase [Labrys miyagiensis]|uniref:Polymerase n=1 Tax=Labrys miyagiensis TaxID=346912 RepID=A0ABQ6CC66_9HYPH|nr:polymerase [Labrys miyagiensis]
MKSSRWTTTLWDSLAALAVLLALETQLRFSHGPMGPGEFLLSLWLAPPIVIAVLRRPRVLPWPFWEILRFWSTLAAALCLGVMATYIRNVPVDWSLVVHDIIAYAFLAAMTAALTILPDGPIRLYRMLWMIVLIGTLLLLLQLANAQGLFKYGTMDPWYWDRMRGWSDNPNQFALMCLLIGFFALALAERTPKVWAKSLATACAGVGLGIGLLAKSNAFSAVVVAILAFFTLAKLARAFARAEKQGVPLASLSLAIMALVGWIACVEAYVSDIRIDAIKASSAIARDDEANEDAALRVHLWEQAIKVGTESMGLGLGPGPHLEIPPSILAGRRDSDTPVNIQHPKPGLAPNFEAHNTVLELFVQGGVMAVLAFGSVIALGVYRSWKAGFDGTTALLFAILIFGSFHVVFRHPSVWFAISFALVGRPRSAGEVAASPSLWPTEERVTQRRAVITS